MINLGAHNSWTFAKPINKWVPRFIYKCQRVDIQKQYDLGARWFDLRVKYYRDNFYIAHGSVVLNADFEKDLKWLNQHNDVYVRVLLEYNKNPNYYGTISYLFSIFCERLEETYVNIKFVGGERKWDWVRLFCFKHAQPPLLDRYSSTTSLFNSESKFLSMLDDWFPWLYAKLKNKKNFTEFCENNKGEYLLLDFIDMIKNVR